MKRLISSKLVLSVLCVIIGLAPLIAMLNTSESGHRMLEKAFGGKKYTQLSIDLQGTGVQYEDLQKLKESMPELQTMLTISEQSGKLQSYRGESNAVLKAVDSDYWKYAGLKLVRGAFFSRGHLSGRQNVVVLDDITADQLFGTTAVLGRSINITINGNDLEAVIVGICKRLNLSEPTLKQDSSVAYIPITTLDYHTQYSIQKMVASFKDLKPDEGQARILHFMEKRGIAVSESSVINLEQIQVLRDFTEGYWQLMLVMLLLWLIGALTALTSIMLLEVETDQKLYGLLKFYGCSDKNIKYKVFASAYELSLISSICSIVIGLAASFVICRILNIEFQISIHSLAVGAIVPVAICLLAAVYPAVKATKANVNKVIWQQQIS